MDSVNIATARALVKSSGITRAVIECYDGRRWAIVLRGSAEFYLKSERRNPKPFVKLETALAEIHSLGLRQCEIEFRKWNPPQKTID